MLCITRGRIAVLAFALCVVVAVLPASLSAQSHDAVDSLRREIEELKQGQLAILQELRALRQRLNPANGPSSVPSPLASAPLIDLRGPTAGSPTARVTVIEFSDYQCPFCGRFFRDTYRSLSAEYIRTGRVRYLVKDFPIASLHPFAAKAAEAAHCAGDQGKYFEMHDLLFANQDSLGPTLVFSRASTIGLDSVTFRKCLETSRHAATVRKGLAEGERAGVSGTPAFFVAVTKPGETQVRPLFALRGAKSYPEFKRVIDAALLSAGQ